MSRLRERRRTLFRGNELPRLLTMIVMLGVMWLLIDRASDESTWRWLIPGSREEGAAPKQQPELAAAEPGLKGPTDQDADELEAAQEEFQAVTDKLPLAKEEMPAYWRLMAWQQHQTTHELRERARNSVLFRQLWQEPEKWRGKLVEIPVHLGQTAAVENLDENPLGLTKAQEAWGWNSDSQPYWFWFVTPELPAAMPQGKNLTEEATFVGYFLKLLPYEDHQGISRATPLLIGRLLWHPQSDVGTPTMSSRWPWMIAGGLAVFLVARWGLMFLPGHERPRSGSVRSARPDVNSLEHWLQRAQNAEEDIAGQEPEDGNPVQRRNDPTA